MSTAEAPPTFLEKVRSFVGAPVGPPPKRFQDLTDEFLAHQAVYTKDQRTVKSNMRILKRALGSLEIEKIGAKEIQEFIAARLAGGVGKPTINRNRAALSKFFSWAIERQYHPGPNPVRQVRKFRESPGRIRYLTADEYGKLLLAAAPHLKKILIVAVNTGGRRSELLSLTWGDVDLERGILYFRSDATKNGKERQVPISDELAETLRSLRPGRPHELVFEYAGRPLKDVRSSFESARLKAKLGDDVVFHTLRHTFASWYIENGGDVFRLQKLLGHYDIRMTELYAHLSPAYIASGVQFIGPPRKARPAKEEGGRS